MGVREAGLGDAEVVASGEEVVFAGGADFDALEGVGFDVLEDVDPGLKVVFGVVGVDDQAGFEDASLPDDEVFEREGAGLEACVGDFEAALGELEDGAIFVAGLLCGGGGPSAEGQREGEGEEGEVVHGVLRRAGRAVVGFFLGGVSGQNSAALVGGEDRAVIGARKPESVAGDEQVEGVAELFGDGAGEDGDEAPGSAEVAEELEDGGGVGEAALAGAVGVVDDDDGVEGAVGGEGGGVSGEVGGGGVALDGGEGEGAAGVEAEEGADAEVAEAAVAVEEHQGGASGWGHGGPRTQGYRWGVVCVGGVGTDGIQVRDDPLCWEERFL